MVYLQILPKLCELHNELPFNIQGSIDIWLQEIEMSVSL